MFILSLHLGYGGKGFNTIEDLAFNCEAANLMHWGFGILGVAESLRVKSSYRV